MKESLFKYLIVKVIFLCFFFVIKAQAQDFSDSLLIIEGRILTNDSLLPVPQAHAISKMNRWGTISDDEGRFIMYTSKNDSILFTSIGFRSYILTVNDSIVENNRSCELIMVKDTVQINEIIIRAFYDYETFKQLVISMEPLDLSNFYLNWNGSELLYRPATPSGFGGPVQALYNLFNRNAVLQRKLIKNRKKYNDLMMQMGRPEDTIPAIPEHMLK